MKNREIISLYNGLMNTSFNNVSEFKFNYAINKNRIKLQSVVEEINSVVKSMTPQTYKELADELMPIVMEAIKGKPQEQAKRIEKETIENWAKYPDWKLACELLDATKRGIDEQDYEGELFMIDYSVVENLPLNDQQTFTIMPLIKQ